MHMSTCLGIRSHVGLRQVLSVHTAMIELVSRSVGWFLDSLLVAKVLHALEHNPFWYTIIHIGDSLESSHHVEDGNASFGYRNTYRAVTAVDCCGLCNLAVEYNLEGAGGTTEYPIDACKYRASSSTTDNIALPSTTICAHAVQRYAEV